MMFETSAENHNGGGQASTITEQVEQKIKQLEDKEDELRKKEQDLLVSKEKVFAKWQEYIEKSESLEVKEKEILHLMD